MSKFQGLDGLRQELQLLLTTKTTPSYLRNFCVGHYALKTINGRSSIVLGCPRGRATKVARMIISYPIKTLRPPREGWPWD